MIAMVKVRLLETDEKFSLRGIIVEKQLKEDRSNGLIPFFVRPLPPTAPPSSDHSRFCSP